MFAMAWANPSTSLTTAKRREGEKEEEGAK